MTAPKRRTRGPPETGLICGRSCGPVQTMTAGAWSIMRFRLRPGYRLGTHAHDLSGFVLCLDGEYRARVSGRDHRIRPGDFMVLGQAVEHEERVDMPTDCLIVTPDAERGPLPDKLQRRLDGFLLVENCVDYSELHRLWFELFVDDDLSACEAADASAEIARGWLDPGRSRRLSTPRWLENAEKRLRSRYAETNVVLRTADDLNISVEHLVRTFRSRFGMTPGQFVRCRRMVVALRALLESDAPISQIALDAGFADQSHFTRLFRAMLRTTPHRYRQLTRA